MVSDETLAVDLIRRAGIGRNYLAQEHTVRHMRQIYWPATVFNQASWEGWRRDRGSDAYARAHQRVKEILAAHYRPEPLLSLEAKRELESLIDDARAHPDRFVSDRYGMEEMTN